MTSTKALVALVGTTLVLAVAVATTMRRASAIVQPSLSRPDSHSSDEEDGRQLSARRRRRRAIAQARELHNSTVGSLPQVENSVRSASSAVAAAESGHPSSGIALDERCHARPHTGYAGDGAAVWGLGFKLRDAGECCAACKAHGATCGAEGGRGKSWWSAKPEMKCGGPQQACTIWTFCPEERCFAFDIHKHGFGECWLKFQADIPPKAEGGQATWRLKDPHFGSPTYPEVMRHSPRKLWPWPVKEELWQGPMPLHVPWMSGALAPAGVEVRSAPPGDRWKERWCKKHGPCPTENFDI